MAHSVIEGNGMTPYHVTRNMVGLNLRVEIVTKNSSKELSDLDKLDLSIYQ